MGKNKNVPKQPRDLARKAIPPQATRARLLVPESGENFHVRWCRFDFGGPWCLSRPEGDLVQLMQRIKSLETKQSIHIFGTGDMYPGTDYYDLSRIPNQGAVKRLQELGFGDETRISRIRVTGAQRFYGFRRDPVFYAIFWDPLHEIYPSPKKHT